MTPPVRRAPGSVYFVTAHAICRMHRFVPKHRVVRMLNYCLRLAATKYEGQVKIHEFLFMSNHAHLLLTDVDGVLSSFMQWLDSIISRNLNAMRGLTGKNFEGYTAQLIEADDSKRQLQSAVYILNNPCAAGLVTRSRHWKATSSLGLSYGQPSAAKRPADGLYQGTLAHLRGRKSARSGRAAYAGVESKLVASLTLHPLPGFAAKRLCGTVLRARVLEGLADAETRLIAMRKQKGTSVVGWRCVVSFDYNAVALSHRELFDVRPTIAASTATFRARAAERIRRFVREYYTAFEAYRSGDRDVIFPHGTWLMVQRHNLACRAAAP